MGKMDYGINGPIRGKVGNVVGSSWRGIPYVKSLPVRKKPPTEGEKINRFIFSMTQKWLQPLAEFLKIGFKDYSPTSNGVNAAKSYMYKHALIKDDYDSRIDPSLMKISHGDLPLSNAIQMEVEKGDNNLSNLTISWDTIGAIRGKKLDTSFSPEDQVMVAVYCAESLEVYGAIHGAFRKSGVEEFEMEVRAGKVYHVYVAFVSGDRARRSDSVYLGSVEGEEKKVNPIH